MSVETVTDMRAYEGALDAEFCHVHLGADNGTLCGCGLHGRSTHYGSYEEERCSGCGRLNCPDCQALARQVL